MFKKYLHIYKKGVIFAPANKQSAGVAQLARARDL